MIELLLKTKHNSRLKVGWSGEVHDPDQHNADAGPREVCLRQDDPAVRQQGRGDEHHQDQVEHRGTGNGPSGVEIFP